MKDTFQKQINQYLQYIDKSQYADKCKYFIHITSRYLETVAKENKTMIGISSVEFPELFIRACGAIPVYLMPTYDDNSEVVDSIFPQISDSIVKANTNLILNDELNFKEKLKGIVYLVTNDSNRKLPYSLRGKGFNIISIDQIQLFYSSTPKNYKKEQKQLLFNFTKLTKKIITKKTLIENMDKITKSSKLFKEIDDSKLEAKLKIFLKESYYLTMDIDKWQIEIEKLIKDIPKSIEKEEKDLLIGSEIYFPNYKITSLLEETGFVDYHTRCCVPYPCDYSKVNKNNSLFNILDQIFDIHYKHEHSFKALSNLKIDLPNNTRSVIFHLLKGQLLSAYYADKIEKSCLEKNIPFICVETDYSKSDKEQIKIRIEAFAELLQVKNNIRRREYEEVIQ